MAKNFTKQGVSDIVAMTHEDNTGGGGEVAPPAPSP